MSTSPAVRAFVVLLSLAAASPAWSTTFTVINTNAAGAGSLRAVIEAANANPGPDTIQFGIVGFALRTIGGNLPPITSPVTIDGYTIGGASPNTIASGATDAVLNVRLDGSALSVADAAILDIQAGPTTIRGLILANAPQGVSAIRVAPGVTGVEVKGCFVGVGADGQPDTGAGTGIDVLGTAQIGGTLAADRNVISANLFQVRLTGPGSAVEGNLLGADADGIALDAGTQSNGVVVDGPDAVGNRIGGTAKGSPNLIVGHAAAAVRVGSDSDATTIQGNSIHLNGFGIDLGLDGVTPNDEGDTDTGANGLQNFPVITHARRIGGDIRIEGYLNSAPGTYRIEFFRNSQVGAERHGEGQTLEAARNVTILEGETAAHFVQEATVDGVFVVPFFMTATATSNATGATSEFSESVEAVDGGDELVVTTTADSGLGSLRGAIAIANSDADRDTIRFEIPGAGPHTIVLQSKLSVNEPLILDGYTQAGAKPNSALHGSDAVLKVVLDGDDVVLLSPVLELNAEALVRGLVVGNGFGNGIGVTADGDESRIEGCFLGTSADGESSNANQGMGVLVQTAQDVTIGGEGRHQRNVISGNEQDGIRTSSLRTRILNNVIGLDASATDPIPNGANGIEAGGSQAVIGLPDGSAPNTIAGNEENGILVFGGSGNRIQGNRIYDNGSLGIDLGPIPGDGVTPNDLNDFDGGPNFLQNFPVLDAIADGPGGAVELSGTLDVAESATVQIDVYANETCDPTGHGEGAIRVASAPRLIDGVDQDFAVDVPSSLAPGLFLTVTATDQVSGDTSEFSACLEVPEGLGPDCGDANLDGDLTASDALEALKTAVAITDCPDCLCDVDSGNSVTASDALAILRVAVGQLVELVCPFCED